MKKINPKTIKLTREKYHDKDAYRYHGRWFTLLSSEENVVIESGNATISGNEAVFDLQNEVYSLKNTRSVFYHES